AGVPRPIRQQLLDRVVLGCPPAIEAGPVHGAGYDPALLADLEDDVQGVGHAGQRTALDASGRCEDLAQLRGEGVRLAGLAVFAAEEAAVVAREDDGLGAEPRGDG